MGKSTVLNLLSRAAASLSETRLAVLIMDVYMADYFCLKHATMDGPFSDDFLDDNRRLSRIIPAKTKAVNDGAPNIDAVRAL